MTQTPRSRTLADVWAEVVPNASAVAAEVGRQVAASAAEIVMTERQRRALQPGGLLPPTLELVRVLGQGWRSPVLDQIKPVRDLGVIGRLADTWAAGQASQMQDSILAAAKATGAHLTVPLAEGLIRNWTPTFDVPTLIQSPVITALAKHAAQMLRQWEDMAALGSPRGRRALVAAREARTAFVEQGLWAPLEAFVRTWLGFKRPKRAHLEATLDALLDADWTDPLVTCSWLWDGETLGALRTRVEHEARWHRPLREGTIRGRSIVMLEDPIRSDEPEGETRRDLLADRPAPDPIGHGFADPRLERVWGMFSPRERDVVLALITEGGTWAEAGIAAGYTAEVGEAVRRKRAHIARLVTQRLEERVAKR